MNTHRAFSLPEPVDKEAIQKQPLTPIKKPESGVIPNPGLLIALLTALPLERFIKPHNASRKAI
jgi:hypothetical protein